MKIRHGHVSNSSSSSFVITVPVEMSRIHKIYLGMIQEKVMRDDEFRLWDIGTEVTNEGGWAIRCFACMDNIDLLNHCVYILGIPEKWIEVIE